MSSLLVGSIYDTVGLNQSTTAQIAKGRAKAWVVFNGTGTVAIREAYNVSSITDLGTGSYVVNFSTSLYSSNYAVSGVCNRGAAATTIGILSGPYVSNPTANTFPVGTTDVSGVSTDYEFVSLIFMGA